MTAPERCYWKGNGRYQKTYDRLFPKLVPQSGPADTPHGEALRAISKVYYDYYNNDACNLRERWGGLRDLAITVKKTVKDLPAEDLDAFVEGEADFVQLEKITDLVIQYVKRKAK